jgi:hypothetical protein
VNDPSNDTDAADAGSANGSGPASVEAAVGSEAAAPAEPPAASPPSTASPPPRSNVNKPAFVRASAGGGADAINLGTTVLPVLAKSYAPHLAAAALGLVVGILIGRRLRG